MTGRVVIFNNMLTPYTTRLFNALVDGGMDLKIVSASTTEPNRHWGKNPNHRFEWLVLPGLQIQLAPQRFAYINRGIISTLNRLKPDLLVINGFYPSMLVAVLWAMFTRTRIALLIDGWAHTMPGSVYHRLIRPFIISRLDAVIVCGTKGRDYFLSQHFPADRIHIVPLVPAWDGPASIKSFDDREFDLVWCAHLNDEVKNAPFLVELCKALKPTRPGLKVRIVGRGPSQEATLAGLASAGVTYEYTESIPWQQISPVFENSRVLVFPSLWEAWGLVCNEGMQCGVPAIASPFTGASDDLVRTGETGAVLPLDAQVWAHEIDRLLTDTSDWSRMSENGRAEMAKRTLAASAAAFAKATRAAMN
jgi:glycosyltransferase involved in cell wall biosynthesis